MQKPRVRVNLTLDTLEARACKTICETQGYSMTTAAHEALKRGLPLLLKETQLAVANLQFAQQDFELMTKDSQ